MEKMDVHYLSQRLRITVLTVIMQKSTKNDWIFLILYERICVSGHIAFIA